MRYFSVFVAALFMASGTATQAAFHTVDFSSQHNHRIQNNIGEASQYPEGMVMLGGVPFDIPAGINVLNAWHSNSAASGGGGTVMIDVSVNLYGVETVHTLINNYWGQAGSNRAMLEFFGTGGAYHSKLLIGNNDIRDFINRTWTNNINGTTTTNVFLAGSGSNQVRLDKQEIALPVAFHTETLQTIRLTDSGNAFQQRTWLAGVTVDAVPEPTTLSLLLFSAAAFSCIRHRIRQ